MTKALIKTENSYQFKDIGIFILLIFCIFRPFLSIEMPGLDIGNKIFNIVFSYVTLVFVLLGLKNIKWIMLDFFIVMMIVLTLSSIMWGSNVSEITKFIFPLFVYFLIRVTKITFEDGHKIIKLLVITLSFPMLLNALLMLFDYGSRGIGYRSGLERFQGIYGGPHTLAHESMIYIFLIIFMLMISKELKIEYNKNWKYIIIALLVVGLFNIYKSYTRTVYLGLIIFSLAYLVGNKKFLILLIILLISFFFVIKSDLFQSIFVDVVKPLEGEQAIETMGSGRIGLWKYNFLNYYSNPEKWIIGLGLGSEEIKNRFFFGASHNDILSLLVSLGVVGLTLYFIIVFLFAKSLLFSSMNLNFKIFAICYILSTLTMNMLSNSYLNRIQLGQYNYLILGILISIRDEKITNNSQKK